MKLKELAKKTHYKIDDLPEPQEKRGVFTAKRWRKTFLDGRLLEEGTIWESALFSVFVKEMEDGWTQLAIQRRDGDPIRSWPALQWIKNDLCGDERTGLEVFPPESKKIDYSHTYHMHVMPEGTSCNLVAEEKRYSVGELRPWCQAERPING